MSDLLMQDAPTAPQPKGRRRGLRILIVLVALGLVLTASAGGYALWAMGGTPDGSPVRIVVPEGASAGDIAALLEAEGVVRSAFVFRVIARLRGAGTDLKPGAYELRTGLGVNEAIAALREGVPVPVERFTIPEGKTVTEIADIVAARTHLTRRAFLRAATNGAHRLALMPRGVTELEGLLFPKTYEIMQDASAGQVVSLLLDQFERETAGLNFGRAERLGVTPYEVVIIASLIEREARDDVDRPKIASVIYNRLARGIRLQIDATVQYAILRQTGSYKKNLTQDDYTAVRSPYNTYQIDGLPPGPIASPGIASLRAALNPADTDFLFYRLYQDSIRHCFSRDAAGHAACGNRTEP